MRRRRYLDNLKVLLIVAIIVIHAVLGYSEFDWWPYSDVREATLSRATEAFLLVVAAPFALIMIPLLFLVAGLLTPPSVARKGPGAFARDRLLRLGVPFAVFVLLLWPVPVFALYRIWGQARGSYWASFIGTPEENIDAGIVWFVGVLLLFSLAYAAWLRARRGHPTRRRGRQVGIGHLVMLTGVVAIGTFLIRLIFPLGSDTYVDLNLWEWPACAAMFGLGIVVSSMGWLVAVPDHLRRQCLAATLVAVGAFSVFAGYGAAAGGDFEEVWGGGWRWTALAFAAGESALAVFGPVWLLGVAQRRLDRRLRWAGPAVHRSAFGAFLLQGLVLIALAVGLRWIPVPAEIKALVVAGGGVVASFALAWLLISRVPGVARVL